MIQVELLYYNRMHEMKIKKKIQVELSRDHRDGKQTLFYKIELVIEIVQFFLCE
jgi:hypothetical protein